MGFMMCTVPWMFWKTNVILFSLKYTKTAISSAEEMIRCFTITAPAITLKWNRRREIKNTENPKNTGQIRSFRWGYLWTAMVSRLLFRFPREYKRAEIFEAFGAESDRGFWMLEVYLPQ